MKKKTVSRLLLLSAVVLLFVGSGCRQMRELHMLTKSKFHIKNISNTSVGGINMNEKTDFSQVGMFDIAKITTMFAAGKMPLQFTVNIEVTNPNPRPAALNKLQWMAYFDNTQIAAGELDHRVEVAPNNGTAIIPLTISTDLKEVLSGESLKSLVNLAINLGSKGKEESRFSLQIKPFFKVGKKQIGYPGYLKLQKTIN